MFVDVNSILNQALDRSPAYGSVQEVLQKFHAGQVREGERNEQKPIILFKPIENTCRTKRMVQYSIEQHSKNDDSNHVHQTSEESYRTHTGCLRNIEKANIYFEILLLYRKLLHPKSTTPIDKQFYHQNLPDVLRVHQVCNRSSQVFQQKYGMHSFFLPAIGDRILIGPQNSGRIVTLPDAEIAMIQLDNIVHVNGAMISNGGLTDHTRYVNVNDFEWDSQHEYWKPKFTSGDKITLQMITVKSETPRPTPPPAPPRTMTPRVEKKLFVDIDFKHLF